MRKPETTPASLDDKRPRIFVVTNDYDLAAALAAKLGAEAEVRVMDTSSIGLDITSEELARDLLKPNPPNRPETDAEMAVLDALLAGQPDMLNIMHIETYPRMRDFFAINPFQHQGANITGFVHSKGGRGKGSQRGGKHKKPRRGR
jgi:hypothetical protein